ncbi:MAG TPA: DUF465 domain-containing protein [Acidobacteria bacterium]|jgi:uncharacterized protein YdcH (DUF465 family)|nr:DUF465 domain-containing protein [Acidobacteriota bacterium]
MSTETEIRERLLLNNEEYQQLAANHDTLDTRLAKLASQHYLSDNEQVEETTLKKRKLKIKDRMEHILRCSRRPTVQGLENSSESTASG